MGDNSYNPDSVSSPAETLLDMLHELKISDVQLSNASGLELKTIREVIFSGAEIDCNIAIGLQKALGIPAEFWLERQKNYMHNLVTAAAKEIFASAEECIIKNLVGDRD